MKYTIYYDGEPLDDISPIYPIKRNENGDFVPQAPVPAVYTNKRKAMSDARAFSRLKAAANNLRECEGSRERYRTGTEVVTEDGTLIAAYFDGKKTY
jgi:hypothetical protein